MRHRNNIAQGRTSLVSLELQKYNIDVAALSDTRHERSVKEHLHIFWKRVQ